MKRCSTCKQFVSRESFSPSRVAPDGLAYVCKPCMREAVRRSKEKHRERFKAAERRYDASPARKQSLALRREAWRDTHRDRYLAGQSVRHAVDRGTLRKLPCLVCGDPHVEGHHVDYSRPLQVVWLCPSHHRQAHAASVSD